MIALTSLLFEASIQVMVPAQAKLYSKILFVEAVEPASLVTNNFVKFAVKIKPLI